MFQVIYTVWQEPEGWVSKCLVSGVTSCGDTQKEAIENLKEAVELYYEDDKVENFERKNFQFGNLIANA